MPTRRADWTNRRPWTSRIGVLLVAAGAVLLASCDRPSPSDPKTIEMWTLALSTPALRDYVQSQIATFEQRHPGVRVRWVDVPFDALDRKLIASAMADRAPDVVNLSDIQYGRFVGLGALLDLSPHLPGDPNATYLSGALSLGSIGGHLYALPWYLTTQVSMINTDLLALGNLEPSQLGTTWTDLRAQGLEYHKKTGKFLFSQPLGAESQIPILMLAEGISPLKANADGTLQAALTSPEAVAFVQGWVDYYRSGAMPPEAATRDHSHLTEMYQNGRLAMIDTGPNFLGRVKDISPGIFDKTVVRSGVTGSLRRQHIATMVVGVTKTTREPTLASELAWHITGAESQTALCRTAMVLPSTSATLDDPVVQGRETLPGTPEAVARARGLAAQSLPKAVAFTPALVTWPDMRRAFEDRIKSALLDGEDVRTVLARIEDDWNRILRTQPEQRLDAVPRPSPADTAGTDPVGTDTASADPTRGAE